MVSEMHTDVAIIGAGPAGLTAAKELRKSIGADVLVIDREQEAGGIPRHSDHAGYGIRDRYSFLTGPVYARKLVDEAASSGATILTQTMVTHWGQGREFFTTNPSGLQRITADAVLLATGARERPRSARMIPGTRPAGVYTTGELQNAVHLHKRKVGKRAVVIGGELVSWSAVMTLKEAGCAATTLVTRHRRPESYALFNIGGRVVLRPEVVTQHRVTQILGRETVTGVEVEDLESGKRRVLACDTVVFTGDWIPDNELARAAGLALDADSKSPVVDALGRTDEPGLFAAGNLVHPVDTADVAALGGKGTAKNIARYLQHEASWRADAVPILGLDPFVWVSPHLHVRGRVPARKRILAWVAEPIAVPRVTVRQNGKVLARRTIPWPASPGRVFRIPSSILDRVDPGAGPVELSL